MLDRTCIETTLRKIQAGELSTGEATELLLGLDLDAITDLDASTQQHGAVTQQHDASTQQDGITQQDVASPVQSLGDLIDRLGTPPPEITQAWTDQLSAIAVEHQRRTGHPLPPIDRQACTLNDRGELVWNAIDSGDFAFDDDELFEASRTQVAAFVDSFSPTASVSVFPSPAASNPTRVHGRTAAVEPSAAHVVLASRPIVRTVAFAAAIAGCAVAGWWVVGDAIRDDPVAVADKPPTSVAASSDVFDFSSSSSETFSGKSTSDSSSKFSRETIAELERFETLDQAALLAEEQKAKSAPPSFLLDSMMPRVEPLPVTASSTPVTEASPTDIVSVSSPAVAPEAGREVTDVRSTNPDEAPPATIPSLGGSIDDEVAPADETEQTTDLAGPTEPATRYVELPDADEDLSGDPFQISDRPLGDLSIEFPFAVPISVARNGDGWSIDDTRKKIAIASLFPSENGVALTWAETAKQSPALASLHHGRLQDDAGSQIYLRPVVQAKPFRLKLDRVDVNPTWNLRSPIGRQTRLTVDFSLPEDVEFGWIEPVEADQLKRTRALAVLTSKGDEDVSLGIRFDIRCSRKLSFRMRYAGRLDSSMPWQTVSTSGVTMFADQLAYQAGLVSQEATRLQGVYDIAGSLGRRIIKAKQQRNDKLADDIRGVADRVASLQSLMAKVDAGGELNLRVHVEWPETTQPILVMQ